MEVLDGRGYFTFDDGVMAKAAGKKKQQDGFPGRLRKLRMQHGLSQIDLGKATGIHYNQIGRYEKGVSQPSAENANRMAAALGVSSDYLINGETANAARANFEDREFLELFQQAARLPEEDKQYVKRFLHSLLNQTKLEEMTAR